MSLAGAALNDKDPYERYRRLRREDPVHYVPSIRGWFVLRYADVVAMFKDARLSSSISSMFFARLTPEQRAQMGDFERTLSLWMLLRDPPDHTRIKGMVLRAFTPRIVASLSPRVEAQVDELLGAVDAAGEMDVIRDLAVPLPVLVIAELLGVPTSDRDRIKVWADDLARFMDSRPVAKHAAGDAHASFMALDEYIKAIADERRRSPRDDLLSALVAPADGAPPLQGDDLVALSSLLLFAGHETTTNLIGNGMLALMRHPEERARFIAEPSLAEPAIEELLRYDSPVQTVWRIATVDMELGGAAIKAGEMVFGVVASANRDDAQFPEPDRLDIGRKDVRHLSFGLGLHFCLGAALARLEGRIALRALLTRHAGIRLVTSSLQWSNHPSLRGVVSLPVQWGA